MLHFPYQDEPLAGPAPPSLAVGAVIRWRPLVPVDIVGTAGMVQHFGRAVLDPAADDTVFPLVTAGWIRVVLRSDTGHRVRWRGQVHALRFGDVELSLDDSHSVWQWRGSDCRTGNQPLVPWHSELTGGPRKAESP